MIQIQNGLKPEPGQTIRLWRNNPWGWVTAELFPSHILGGVLKTWGLGRSVSQMKDPPRPVGVPNSFNFGASAQPDSASSAYTLLDTGNSFFEDPIL